MTPDEAYEQIQRALSDLVGGGATLGAKDRTSLRSALNMGYDRLSKELHKSMTVESRYAKEVDNLSKQLVAAAAANGVAAIAVDGGAGDETIIAIPSASLSEVLKRICPIWPFC